jgi:hypothetical protein
MLYQPRNSSNQITTTYKLQNKNYKQKKTSTDSSPPPTKSRVPATTPASHPCLRQTTRFPAPPGLHHTPPIQRLVRLLTLAYPLQLVVESVKVQMVAVVVAVAVAMVVLVLGETRVMHAYAHAHTHAYTSAIRYCTCLRGKSRRVEWVGLRLRRVPTVRGRSAAKGRDTVVHVWLLAEVRVVVCQPCVSLSAQASFFVVAVASIWIAMCTVLARREVARAQVRGHVRGSATGAPTLVLGPTRADGLREDAVIGRVYRRVVVERGRPAVAVPRVLARHGLRGARFAAVASFFGRCRHVDVNRGQLRRRVGGSLDC